MTADPSAEREAIQDDVRGGRPADAGRIARAARESAGGFIDGCHPQYRERPGDDLCPVCEAIERVAVIAIRAALSSAPAGPADAGGGRARGIHEEIVRWWRRLQCAQTAHGAAGEGPCVCGARSGK